MEITFKYQNKIITTPNLQKKLKRMKITETDIEIIEEPIKKEEDNSLEIPLSKYHRYKYPNKDLWHIYITDNPPLTINFNNQILTYEGNYF